MNEFKCGDRVKLNFSFKNKLAGSLSWLWHIGEFRWPPSEAWILFYREEMLAYEVADSPDQDYSINTWYVTHEHMEKINETT